MPSPTPVVETSNPTDPGKQPWGNHLLVILGWLLLAYFSIRTGLLGDIANDVLAFQIAYVVGFFGYACIVVALRRRGAAVGRRRGYAWLIGCVLLRIPLLHVMPSDDLYRCVWEGRVQLEGANPYAVAPNDSRLAHLRGDDWGRINHADYPAIYPPLSQLEFLVAAALYPSIYTVKIMHVLWDVLAIVVLASCLRKLGRCELGAMLFGLCPLVLTAFGIEGHVDSLMLLALAMAIRLSLSGRMMAAGVALGAAIGIKLVPVVLLPWFLWRHWKAAATALLIFLIGYLPYLSAGTDLLASLFRFGTRDEFFNLLGTLPEPLGQLGESRVFALVCLAIMLGWLTIRRARLIDYAPAAFVTTLCVLPVVHFWYWAWIVVYLPIRTRTVWMVTALAFVVYFEAAKARSLTGVWDMPTWSPKVVWGVFLGSLLCQFAAGRFGRRSGDAVFDASA